MQIDSKIIGFALAGIVALSGGCSSGDTGTGGTSGSGGGTGEALIGSEGGALTTTDGRLTLTVPAGALQDDTLIRISPIAAGDAPASVQALPGELTIYELQPEGLRFDLPARLEASVPAAVTRTANDLSLRLAFLLSESEGTVEALGNQTYRPSNTSVDDATVSGDIMHFSSAVVQFFNGATISADVPESVDVGASFDVTVTIDIEGSGLDPIAQAFLSDFSDAPVELVGELDETFVGTATLQAVTNTYTCSAAGVGQYNSLASFVVDNAIGPDTGTQLSASVDCVEPLVPFEVSDPAPGSIGRAPGSNFAAYATRTGATVVDLRNGNVLQRVARSDSGDFPTSFANAYVPEGQVQAVIVTQSDGVAGAFFGASTFGRLTFIPDFGGDNVQYAPGRFVSFANTPYFYDIDESGANDIDSLNDALIASGLASVLVAYVSPEGFTESSSMLALRNVGNPAVDAPELVELELEAGVVSINPIPRNVTPDPLNLAAGFDLKCIPDPARGFNAVCGAVASGDTGGVGFFRWVPAENPNLQIQSIRSTTGGGLDRQFIGLDVINTGAGTRFASTNLEGQVRIDDVATDAGGTTTFVSTPGQCGTGIDVEFRNSSDSVLLSCLATDSVVTLDVPPFGGGGTGGNGGAGGSGGGGGAGGSGSCVDDIGARPTLTARPTLSPMNPVEGGQVEVGLEVSAEARVVRVRLFDGFSNLGGEAMTTTTGSESLTLTIDITNDATNFDYFLGVSLCDENNTDCLENSNASSVSYTRPSSTSGLGDPYFVSVRDDGASIPAVSTLSCFDLVVFKIANAP